MDFSAEQVIQIAKHVGDQILMPYWGKVESVTKGDGSPVTKADKEASAHIISELTKLTPDIPVISEESSDKENKSFMDSSLRWVIDPLDGTATFLQGPKYGDTAGFGVHIGLVENGAAIKGFVYFPAQKNMFYTGDDGQAYLQHDNNPPEAISINTKFENGIIQCAVPWPSEKRPESVNGHSYNPVPTVGGEGLCAVACGDADLMWYERSDLNNNIEDRKVFSHWDVVAAHAILKAAGGNFYDMNNGNEIIYNDLNFNVPPCVAGHQELLTRIGFTPQNPSVDDPETGLHCE